MSGPSGTESDETRSSRGLDGAHPSEAITRVLAENLPSGGTVMHPGDWQEWVAETAAEIVTALELREETRTAGYVNTAKYESAYVPVIERRWVSSWTSGSDQ